MYAANGYVETDVIDDSHLRDIFIYYEMGLREAVDIVKVPKKRNKAMKKLSGEYEKVLHHLSNELLKDAVDAISSMPAKTVAPHPPVPPKPPAPGEIPKTADDATTKGISELLDRLVNSFEGIKGAALMTLSRIGEFSTISVGSIRAFVITCLATASCDDQIASPSCSTWPGAGRIC